MSQNTRLVELFLNTLKTRKITPKLFSLICSQLLEDKGLTIINDLSVSGWNKVRVNFNDEIFTIFFIKNINSVDGSTAYVSVVINDATLEGIKVIEENKNILLKDIKFTNKDILEAEEDGVIFLTHI